MSEPLYDLIQFISIFALLGVHLFVLLYGTAGKRTERPVYVTYVVEANPWSRITKVVRMKEPEAKK